MRTSVAAILIAAGGTGLPVFAQNPAGMAQGTAFGNTIAPTSNSQVVNPAAVNSTAWSNGTSVSTSVPQNLGGFSSPTNNTSLYTSAQGMGLLNLGTQAQNDCANYVSTGDPAQDQKCAAINFLSGRCLSASQSQSEILGKLGTSQTAATNCAGTYGQGQQAFNFKDQVTATDPVFTSFGSAASGANTVAGSTCAPQSVQVSPAKYSLNNCTVTNSAAQESCSQYQGTTIYTNRTQSVAKVTTTTCPIPAGGNYDSYGGFTSFASMTLAYNVAGQNSCYYFVLGNINYNGYLGALEGQFGQRPLSWNQDYGRFELATWTPGTQYCPVGSTPDGNVCLTSSSYVATFNPYPCPSGSSSCTVTSSAPVPVPVVSCPTGTTRAGSSCLSSVPANSTTDYYCTDGSYSVNGVCSYQTMVTTWTDACGQFEASAGSMLGTP